MTDQIKPLESYSKNGHKFTLYCRAGNLAIFKSKDLWHVARILVAGKREYLGSRYSCTTPEAARERFELELLKTRGKESAE